MSCTRNAAHSVVARSPVAPAVAAMLLLLAGCSRPPAPDPQGPPEPQAMRKAMTQPLDKAHAASDAAEDAQHKQDQSIEDATR